jgi:hypothetical protein
MRRIGFSSRSRLSTFILADSVSTVLVHWSWGLRRMLPTKIGFGTSNPVMRTAVALTMALMLVSLSTCPAIACPLGSHSSTSSKSSCHEPKPQQPTSCPRTTIQTCPYLSLEKSTAANPTINAVSVALKPITPEVPALNRLSSPGIEDRLPNSAGLFLRIRVLLI